MGWPQNTPDPVTTWNVEDANYKPQLDNPAWLAKRDELLKAWNDAQDTLAKAKETEMTARKAAQAFSFGPSAKEGMNNQELNNGYTLKFGKKLNTTITATNDQVDEAEDKAEELGDRGKLLFERCIKWTPEFVKSEFKKLDAADPIDKKVKALVEGLVTTKEATGSLEIKAPKAGLNG